MANYSGNSGSFVISDWVIDGNAKATVTVSWARSGNNVTFSAVMNQSWCDTYYNSRLESYVYYGNPELNMRISVGGTTNTSPKTHNYHPANSYAGGYGGWRVDMSNVSVPSITKPWQSSDFSVTLAFGRVGYSANITTKTYTISVPALTYTVSYNGNGNTGGSTSSQTKNYDETLTLRPNGYTRTGYHFTAWNTASDGSGASYPASGSYTANEAVTLYAQWAIDTYAVTYNGNGATGGSTEAQTKTYGTALTLQSNGFTRTNYTFLYWNTSADGTGTTYEAGATYTTNAALSLFAIWKKNNIPVFANDNGTIRQIEKAYVNVNGVIKEVTVYANVNGTIKEFT